MNIKALMRVFQRKQLVLHPSVRMLSTNLQEDQPSLFFKKFKVEKEELFDSILDMSDKQVQR